MLWRCWLGGRKGIRPVKNWVVGCRCGYLGWGADLHMAQQMPLPLTISCSSKSRLVLPFWYLLTQVVPDKFQKSSKTIVCVFVRACVHACVHAWFWLAYQWKWMFQLSECGYMLIEWNVGCCECVEGITYDTGGADVKHGGTMAGMHRDKCGAAFVAGFFQVHIICLLLSLLRHYIVITGTIIFSLMATSRVKLG